MDAKKICFIICTNNSLLLSECMEYIKRLEVPQGYSVDAISIVDAKSMTSGYNEGRNSTDAKYKVYMHQDVFIINRRFIYDILDIFSRDERIGMIGMVGYKEMHHTGVMWNACRYGCVPMYGAEEKYKNTDFSKYNYCNSCDFEDVKVIDGLMMVTSYDIEWDEEFDAWDFYDASQSARYIQEGYRIVTPKQTVPWFVHDDGRYLTVWNYDRYRKLFMTKYKSFLDY